MKRYLLIIVSILQSCYLLAQQTEDVKKQTIIGVVTDTLGHELSTVVAIVMDATDTTSIAWEYTDKDGRFQVQYSEQRRKRLLLYLQANGYQSRYITLRDSLSIQDLGQLILQPLHLNLSTATVTAIPVIKQQFVQGRDEFEIPQELGESKYDIYALLAEIPGLNVEGEKVEIIGRNGGVKFTINGLEPRPGELANLPPGDVEKVSVDRMPSSRFDKSVSGVINIITRKKLSDYVSMRITEGFAMTCEPVNTTSAVINGKFNRLSTYLNVAYSYGRYYEEHMETYTLHLDDKDFVRKKQSTGLFVSRFPVVAFSPKYQINDKSFVDLQYNYRSDKTREETPSIFEMVEIEKSVTDRQNNNHGGKHDLQLRYVYGNPATSRLVLSAGYAGNYIKRHDVADELVTMGDNVVENLYTDYWSRTTNDVFTFSTDYERNFNKNIAFSAGGSFGEIWNTARQDYVQGTSTLTETEESQASLYANLNHQINKFNYRIGLHGEYLYKHQADDSRVNDNSFLLLPSVSVSYTFDRQTNLRLYYRRSNTHPSLRQRNPILNYINKYEYSQGNPDLKSSVDNEFYLGGALPYHINFHCEYHFIKNYIVNTRRIYNAEKIQTLATNENLPYYHGLTATISWWGKWEWFSMSLNGEISKDWLKSLEVFDYFQPKKPLWKIQFKPSAKINQHIMGWLTFNYASAFEGLNFRKNERYSLSATMQMTFFQRRLVAMISCANIINSNPHNWTYYQNITSEGSARLFERRFNISISYTFKNFVNWFQKNNSNSNILKRLD